MKLLGIELSSSVGSIALLHGDAIIVREIPEPRAQSAAVLPLIDELLRSAALELGDLDGIAVGRGPGSFTGIRVAAAVAQGLGLASEVPLLPVSSLLALAQQAYEAHGITRALACVDARMGEVYFAPFEIRDGVAEHLAEERIAAPGEVVPPPMAEWSAVGDGFAAHEQALAACLAAAQRNLPDVRPSARALFACAARDLRAGRVTAPADALPVYLREQTAWRAAP